jgi:hypothetical protein
MMAKPGRRPVAVGEAESAWLPSPARASTH